MLSKFTDHNISTAYNNNKYKYNDYLFLTGESISRAEDEHIRIIQSIMDKCMKKESLLNELYLQLIKQTTDHPDANSRVNLKNWALLSVLCSVILPSMKAVRKYLIAHLKRCSSDFLSEEGKYARYAENVCTVQFNL